MLLSGRAVHRAPCRSSCTANIPPKAFPSLCIPLALPSSPRAEPLAPLCATHLGSRGAGSAASRGQVAGGCGMPQRQRGRVLPLRSGPLKREWGGRRQPTGWERLLNMQMDVQEVRSSARVQPPSLTLPRLIAPGVRQARAGAELPRRAEGQTGNSSLQFGLETPSRTVNRR